MRLWPITRRSGWGGIRQMRRQNTVFPSENATSVFHLQSLSEHYQTIIRTSIAELHSAKFQFQNSRNFHCFVIIQVANSIGTARTKAPSRDMIPLRAIA